MRFFVVGTSVLDPKCITSASRNQPRQEFRGDDGSDQDRELFVWVRRVIRDAPVLIRGLYLKSTDTAFMGEWHGGIG